MTQAFVFGKFLPFHAGHEGMIRFALRHCDRLTVLVCCGAHEPGHWTMREAWLRDTFAGEPRITVMPYTYGEHLLSGSSVASEEASAAWAGVFSRLLPGHSLLITSEPYGEMVARAMGIRHLPYDPGRLIAPVSATMLRADVARHWHYLPPAVRPAYAIRIILAGTESTGKTTLTQRLAAHFHASAVMEAARDLIADSNGFSIADLYAVARAHAALIEAAATGESALLFIDTDVWTTQSYARAMFGEELLLPEHILQSSRATLRFYLSADAPYIQDGTRLQEAHRNAMDASHRRTLDGAGMPYTCISGTWDERFEACVAAVNMLLDSQTPE